MTRCGGRGAEEERRVSAGPMRDAATGDSSAEQASEERLEPHPALRSALLWWALCTMCGLAGYSGAVPLFGGEQQLWEILLGDYGWSRRDDGRVLCPAHTAVADCETDGHQLSRWMQHPLEEDLDWRYCLHCGGRFEQRIVTPPPSQT